jgi:hypothetical protein
MPVQLRDCAMFRNRSRPRRNLRLLSNRRISTSRPAFAPLTTCSSVSAAATKTKRRRWPDKLRRPVGDRFFQRRISPQATTSRSGFARPCRPRARSGNPRDAEQSQIGMVISEWGAAWALQKRLVPILLGCVAEQLPERLRKLQGVQFHLVPDLAGDRFGKVTGQR